MARWHDWKWILFAALLMRIPFIRSIETNYVTLIIVNTYLNRTMIRMITKFLLTMVMEG